MSWRYIARKFKISKEIPFRTDIITAFMSEAAVKRCN